MSVFKIQINTLIIIKSNPEKLEEFKNKNKRIVSKS
jgi:hypothetical protein